MSAVQDNNEILWEQLQQEIRKEIDIQHWDQAYQQIKDAGLIIAGITNDINKSKARKRLQSFQSLVIPHLIIDTSSSRTSVDTVTILQESSRQLNESEQIGIQTLDKLKGQRQQMEHSKSILDKIRDKLSRSSSLLTKMLKRGWNNSIIYQSMSCLHE
jgi:hypothetical protein